MYFDVNLLLSILVIPVIHAGVAMVTVNEGDTAVLDCNATGNPPPVVSWFHSSLLIPEEGDISIYQAANDSLVLMNVSEEDDGDYVCLAVNEAGSEMAHILLVVNGNHSSICILHPIKRSRNCFCSILWSEKKKSHRKVISVQSMIIQCPLLDLCTL